MDLLGLKSAGLLFFVVSLSFPTFPFNEAGEISGGGKGQHSTVAAFALLEPQTQLPRVGILALPNFFSEEKLLMLLRLIDSAAA